MGDVKGEKGTLNVVFHGTFVFVHTEGDNRIRVLLPKFHQHVFRAGNWLGETELAGSYEHDCKLPDGTHRESEHEHDGQCARLRLEGAIGVSPADFKLPIEHNLVLRGNDRTLKLKGSQFQLNGASVDDSIHAVLEVPLPKKIVTPRRAQVPVSSFDDPDQDLTSSNFQGNVGTLDVFRYGFDDDAELKLASTCCGGGHFWEPSFAGNEVNLHIFSEPDHDHESEHARNSFNHCMALLGFKLKLNDSTIVDEFFNGEMNGMNVAPEETEDLAPRARRLSLLGRMRKENRDLDLLWFENEALNGDPSSCGRCWYCNNRG